MRFILAEIIRKECEDYQLVEMGLLASVESGIELVYSRFASTAAGELADAGQFLTWRKAVLQFFYQSVRYNAIFREGKDEQRFQRLLFSLKNKVLNIYKERYTGETIDASLAVPPRTVAFRLSRMLAAEQYRDESVYLDEIQMPADIERLYQQRCASYYPIDLKGFLQRLRVDDGDFWYELLHLVKQMAMKMASYLTVSNQYKEEVSEGTWEETYLFMKEKIRTETLPGMESALHLRNYLFRVCRNKGHEMIRIVVPDELSGFDDAFWVQVKESAEQDPPPFLDYVDIDPGNNEEVSRALTIILLDKEEPWYERLTRDMADHTDILLQYYGEGHSYEEIAGRMKEGEANLTEAESIRQKNALRQTVSRTRRLLKQRFIELLRKEQKRSIHEYM